MWRASGALLILALAGCGSGAPGFMEGKWQPDEATYLASLAEMSQDEQAKELEISAKFRGASLEIDESKILTRWGTFGYQNTYRVVKRTDSEFILDVNYLRNGTFRWVVRKTAKGIEIRRDEGMPVPFKR